MLASATSSPRGVVAITYPVLLELPAPELSGYPVETTIAEKLEAIVDLGLAISRMKDFFESMESARRSRVRWRDHREGCRLRPSREEELRCLCNRQSALTDEFASDRDKIAQWSAFARRLRIQNPPTLLAVVERIASFAVPVFVAIITNTAHPTR
jgi:hypothetical protein